MIYMDSSGISVLIESHQKALESNNKEEEEVSKSVFFKSNNDK